MLSRVRFTMKKDGDKLQLFFTNNFFVMTHIKSGYLKVFYKSGFIFGKSNIQYLI